MNVVNYALHYPVPGHHCPHQKTIIKGTHILTKPRWQSRGLFLWSQWGQCFYDITFRVVKKSGNMGRT